MAPAPQIAVLCPGCARMYQVPPTLAGAPVTCGSCGTDFVIPDPHRGTSAFPLPPAPLSPAFPPLPAAPAPAASAGPRSADAAPHPPSLAFTQPPSLFTSRGVEGSAPDVFLPAIPPVPELPGKDSHRAADPEDAAGFVEEASVPPRRGSLLKSLFIMLSGAAAVLAVYQFVAKKPSTEKTTAPADGSPALTENPQLGFRPSPLSPPSGSRAAPDTDSASTAASPAVPAAPASPPPEAVAPAVRESHREQDTPPVPPEPVSVLPALSAGSPSPAVGSPAASAPASPGPLSPTEAAAAARRESHLTLERFLTAKTPAERLALCQKPDKIRPAFEAWHRGHPGTVFEPAELQFLTSGQVPDSPRIFHLYNAFLKGDPTPLPVAVEQTDEGFRVDWEAFIESHMRLLADFFEKPAEKPGIFRIILRRSHYFGPPVPGQDRDRLSYNAEPPTRDVDPFTVWVDKASPVYRSSFSTGARAGWETESYVIAELRWRKDSRGHRWVALERILSDSWRSE